MTIEFDSNEAIAEFLEHLARLIRLNQVEAISLEVRKDGPCRANVIFAPASVERSLTSLKEQDHSLSDKKG
jgi:hypothetical protein